MTVSRRFQHLLCLAAVIFAAAAAAAEQGGVRRLGGSNRHDNDQEEEQEGDDDERRRRQLLRMDYADQPCTCACTRVGGDFDGGGKPGVLVKRLNSNTDRCIKYGAVQRRIDRGRIECVPTADCTEQRVTNAATASSLQKEMDPECPCTCARGNKGNNWGVWISMTRDGERQCARNGRAGRSIAKDRAVCVPKEECPADEELIEQQQATTTFEDDFDEDEFDDMYDEVFIGIDERSGFQNNNNFNAAGARPSQTQTQTQMGGGGANAYGDDEVPVCDCKCNRGGNRWGVWISTRGRPAECARNGRAGRSIGKGRSQCVSSEPNCPDF